MNKKIIPVLVMLVLISSVLAANSPGRKQNPMGMVDSIKLYRDGNSLKWKVTGYSPYGFKVVWSKYQNPVYPPERGGSAVYIEDPYNLEFDISDITDPGLYYFRIGEYIDGEIGVYSNQIGIQIGEGAGNPAAGYEVEEIKLENYGSHLEWTVKGYSEKGFKVVWSKKPDPIYPTRSSDEYIYLGDPYSNEAELYPFDGPGWYFIRVGEYLGGEIGVYSNQLKIYLSE